MRFSQPFRKTEVCVSLSELTQSVRLQFEVSVRCMAIIVMMMVEWMQLSCMLGMTRE
jgi:hypothetical protein